MHRHVAIAVILAPLLAGTSHAQLGQVASDDLDPGSETLFEFNPEELAPIRYTRVENATAAEAELARHADRQTRFSFKLEKPTLPEFTRSGNYGLGLFGTPTVAIQSSRLGPNRLSEALPDLHDGFAYSAGVKVEHEEEDIDGTAYVSSSLLGLSYGRLGRVWYGGIDVNLERFADDYHGVEQPDVLSLDLTTGRRLGFTGLSADSPLWLLSLEGNFDVNQDIAGEPIEEVEADWFLNPSLFWQQPGFTFSAQVQVPVEGSQSTEGLEDEPDYRLRAIFEKQFK